jgi:hypothetical protein
VSYVIDIFFDEFFSGYSVCADYIQNPFIKLLHKCFELLCSLLMIYRLGLCVLLRTYRQDYETFFHIVILSKHHHHYNYQGAYSRGEKKCAAHVYAPRTGWFTFSSDRYDTCMLTYLYIYIYIYIYMNLYYICIYNPT